ncbi:DUF6090 family protein [Marinicella sp. X102]|nr:DUF6090 family protein [Marinicella marina]
MIVIIGVFIGIQVANWNDQLAGERQAKILLKRIHHDLTNDILSIQAELQYQAVVRNYALTAVDALNQVGDVSDEQFVIGAYQATQVNSAWSNRATYNEMLSTGQINLIQDEALKAQIFGYYAVDFSKIDQVTKVAPYREFARGHIPVAIQDAIKNQCGDEVYAVANAFSSKLPATCDLDYPDEKLMQTAELLRSLPDMLFNLQFQIAVNDTKVFNFENFIKESEKLMKLTERYLP